MDMTRLAWWCRRKSGITNRRLSSVGKGRRDSEPLARYVIDGNLCRPRRRWRSVGCRGARPHTIRESVVICKFASIGQWGWDPEVVCRGRRR